MKSRRPVKGGRSVGETLKQRRFHISYPCSHPLVKVTLLSTPSFMILYTPNYRSTFKGIVGNLRMILQIMNRVPKKDGFYHPRL